MTFDKSLNYCVPHYTGNNNSSFVSSGYICNVFGAEELHLMWGCTRLTIELSGSCKINTSERFPHKGGVTS